MRKKIKINSFMERIKYLHKGIKRSRFENVIFKMKFVLVYYI